MTRQRHFINGIEYLPRNWQEIEFTIDWLSKNDSATINISELQFVGQANKYLQQRILNGLNGGVGIFEGDSYEIHIGEENDNENFVFKGYLDFTDSLGFIGKEETTCLLKKQKGNDWLNDVADSFSFAYLYDQGVITDSDFVKVPYVINYVPDNLQLSIISMSIFMMTKEIIENVEKLSEAIADITDSSTPVTGTTVVPLPVPPFVTVGVTTAFDLGNFLLVILKALARLIYVIAMSIAIANLISELFEQLLPKKRNHYGMTFRRMFELGCQYLNLSFYSDISELEWVHIPRKSKKGEENDENDKSGVVGFPSNTEPIYLFGDLIRVMMEKFNAEYRIKDDVFYFQRRDKFEFPSSYQIPNYFNNQERLLEVNGFNTNEMVANYNINWAFDVQDQNTLNDPRGRVFQGVTTPITKNNDDFVAIKGLAEITIPFSLGLEKRKLTDVEVVAKSLGSIVDLITGIFGNGTNFEQKIKERIGSLLLSSHYTTFGKVVAMSGSKLKNDQREILSAEILWNNYHFINSFAEYQDEHNQYWLYKNQRVPMNLEDFKILLENNIATDDSGNEYEIEKVVYNPEMTTGIVDFRIKRKYTNNLKIEFI